MQFGQIVNLTFKSKEWCDKEYPVMGDYVRHFPTHAKLEGEYDIDAEVESFGKVLLVQIAYGEDASYY